MLKNKKILVVGASRGIGKAMALSFAREGADLVITGRHLDTLIPVVEEIKRLGREAWALEWDVSDVKRGPQIMEQAAGLLGGLDVVVNNAGVIDRERFLEIREEEWDRIFSVNVKGAYFCCQSAANWFLSHKAGEIKGKIIVVGSECGNQPHISPYGISKWSVRGMCLGLGKALFRRGVIVMNLCPGPVTTEMMNWKEGDSDAWNSAFGRMAHPEEIADFAVFLASDRCNRIAGVPLYINGGLNF